MIIFLFSVGLLSMSTKLEVNKRYVTIEFRHSFMLKGLILIFLCYNIFFVMIKGRAYIDWRRGYALVQSGKLPEGIALYEKAMKKRPETGELLFHLGSAYAYTNDPKKALPYLEQSKATFNDKNIYISEGLCYYRLGDFRNAQKSLSKALRMYPNLLLPRLWLAEIYLQTDREYDAVRLLREIIEIQPKEYSKDAIIIKHDAEQLLSRILE
jgi:tetratricopeptide (TPR) repeat protein